MMLHIVGPQPHQLTRGHDEQGRLWELLFVSSPHYCSCCGRVVKNEHAYYQPVLRQVIHAECVTRIEHPEFVVPS